MNEKQLSELERLSALLKQGTITKKEFETNKAAVLGKTTDSTPAKSNKRATVYYWVFGIIGLIAIYFLNKENTPKPKNNRNYIIGQLREVYTRLCQENGHLRLLKIYPATEDSYVVEIEVDETIEVTKDTNTQEQNQQLTRKWTNLVNTPEAGKVAQTNDILILTVRQIGKKGELYSIAFVDSKAFDH
jgi:hypothetical protein